jgi:hypothetical protein
VQRLATSFICIIKQSLKVHVYNVSASKACVLGAKDTVPLNFGRDHVGSLHCEFEQIIY